MTGFTSPAPVFIFQPLEGRQLLAANGLAGAYFARTNLTLAKYSELDPAIDLSWTGGTPNALLGTDGFSVRWTGQIMAKYSETHTFTVTSTGGVRLWVNGGLIIDDWASHPLHTDVGSARLTAGRLTDIRLEYWNDGHSPQIKLEWQSPRMAKMIVPKDRLFSSTLDHVAPTTPGHLRGTPASATSVNLQWDASTDPSGVVDYDVYVGSTKVVSLLPNQLSYVRGGLSPSTGYTFSVQAVDAAGNASALATTALTTSAPQLPPSVPTGLHVTGITSTSISLQWNASSDDGTVTGYRIYRNGVKLAVAPTGTTFTDTTVAPSTNYTYSVRAADNSGLFSPNSASVNTTTPSGSVSHDPYSGINAVDHDDASGVSTSSNEIASLDNGDWVLFKNVEFGSAGANSVTFNLGLANGSHPGNIELHLDGINGTNIVTFTAQPTGNAATFKLEKTNISHVSGTHDLYVVFKDNSDIAHLRSIQFSSSSYVKVMALGDSITQGYQDAQSYRSYLWQSLVNAGLDAGVDFVGSQIRAANGDPATFNYDQNHEGHTGWTADQIAANAQGWASQFQPDIVMLHIGTNDLIRGQSVDSTISDIQNIINNLRSAAPNVKILLAQIIPISGLESQVDLLNQGIASLAAQMTSGQSPITVVDQNTGFDESHLYDGIHPDTTADQQIAARWFTALSALLQ